MLLSGYIDDSADQSKSIAAVAGAFLGNSDQWNKLTMAWDARLAAESANYYRSTALRAWRRPFFRYQKRDLYTVEEARSAEAALRSDLEAIIKESGVIGFAHYIPLEMYNRVRETVPMAGEIFPKDAFEAALQSLIRDCAVEFINHYGREHRLSFVCDESDSAHIIREAYQAFKKYNVGFTDILGTLTFADDKVTPPLQAADMMADIGRQVAIAHIRDGVTAHDGSLNSSIYFVRHWDESKMLGILAHQLKTQDLRV